MNVAKYGIGLLATVVFWSNVAAIQAEDSVTLPFRALGNVVSSTMGPGNTIRITAQGRATLLGQYNARITLTIFPGNPPLFSGVSTMVNDDGEELHVINFGVMTDPPPIPGGDGGFEIVGGTGRFAGARGRGDFSSHGGVTTFDGTITLQLGD